MLKSKTIVFIAGAFVSNSIWDNWVKYFLGLGYAVHAPWWPGKDAPAEVMRKRHPDADLAQLRLRDLISYFKDYVASLPEKPVLVGEGWGGALVQLLMQHDIAVAVIAIQPWKPDGLLPVKFRQLLLLIKILCRVKFNTSCLLPPDKWFFLLNGKPPENRLKEIYSNYAVPESRKLLWDILLGAKMDYRKPHVPILFFAKKHPFASIKSQYRNFSKYSNKLSDKEFDISYQKYLPVLSQSKSLDIANYVHNWISHRIGET